MEAKQIEAFHKRRESERGLASQSFEAFAYRKVLHQLVNLKVRIGIAEVQAGYKAIAKDGDIDALSALVEVFPGGRVPKGTRRLQRTETSMHFRHL